VVIGPESTGKSTLCKQLAAHYNTLWCPEYARAYLEVNGSEYTFEDLANIAVGQLAIEDDTHSAATKNSQAAIFIDTNMYVMQVWCEFVFGKCYSFILDEIATRSYDLYLLCNVDLPWVKDELREYPELETREKLFHIYHELMVQQSTPWVLIEGDYDQRLHTAIAAVDRLLKR